MTERSCTVAIIGAGVAGSALAVLLARCGADVVLLDRTAATSVVAIGESVPPDVRAPLSELGLLKRFVAAGHAPCLGSRTAWGGPVCSFNDFLINPQGTGWHLDRARFDSMLRDAAAETATLVKGSLRDARPTPDGMLLKLDAGHGHEITLRTRYAVDASGARAVLARRLGARPLVHDRLVFVYGFFQATNIGAQEALTLSESVPEGWWYAAPLPGRRIAIAFATDLETARRDAWTREHRWLAGLAATTHVKARLRGSSFETGSLVVRSAPVQMLSRVQGERWLSVGDACSVHDPIGAEGITKALEDALAAARSLLAADAANGPIDLRYGEAAHARYHAHLSLRDWLYGLEQRWPSATFWRSRSTIQQSRAA